MTSPEPFIQSPVEQPQPSRQPLPESVRLALAAYDASLNSIISMTAIRDGAGNVVDFMMQTANRAVERSLFLLPEKIINTRLLETFPGNIESGLFAVYVRVVESGQPEQTTQYYADANGLEAWFEVSAVKQEPDGVVLTFINITDRKRAELALQQQTDLLTTVLNNTQTAISLHEAIRDTNGRIVDFRTLIANQQAISMWGEWAEGILTKPFFEVATPEQQTIDFPKYVRVVETGESDLSEFNIGQQWLLRLTAKSGDGVVISNVDVSENRRYRQQLETANTELKRSNENLQSFAYIASHDLQEPLRKIQSFGDILRDRYAPELGSDGSDLINRMQAAAERMSLLIRDLLDYSRIASDRNAFRPFSLTKLINDIIEDLWHPIRHAGAQIDIGELPTLTGDRSQLRQLFQNLLSNALKFYQTSSSGTIIPPAIQVSAQLVDGQHLPTDLLIEVSARRCYQAITISDNGIGFSQQYADRIFQVFQRLHGKQQFAGTGIGLAVVKKVVEQHEGSIRVQSTAGAGATFTIYLPAVSLPHPNPSPAGRGL